MTSASALCHSIWTRDSKWAHIPITLSLSALGWDLSLPEVEGTKPSWEQRHSLWHMSHWPLCAPSTAPRSTSASQPLSARNARRTERNSSSPPRLRASRRGEIHMLGHTSGIKNSSAKWEGHSKWGECAARRLWSVAEEAAHRAGSCNFGIYLGGNKGRSYTGERAGIFCAQTCLWEEVTLRHRTHSSDWLYGNSRVKVSILFLHSILLFGRFWHI